MNNDELIGIFDRQAPGYDQQWTRMEAINNGLFFLLESVFAELPAQASILCVGVGTGKELIYFANKFPEWRFTAVEPSKEMLNICREQVEKAGFSSRCVYHEGYLDSLAADSLHDAATCFLVSQFILDSNERSALFEKIAGNLRPGGILASADLCANAQDSAEYDALLAIWHRAMSNSQSSPAGLRRMKTVYARDVAVLTPNAVASIIQSAGFDAPVPFFQAGLIHAWFAKQARTLR